MKRGVSMASFNVIILIIGTGRCQMRNLRDRQYKKQHMYESKKKQYMIIM